MFSSAAERAFVRRMVGEDLAIDLDGALAITELGLEGVTEAVLEIRDLGIVLGELDLAAQDLGELGPLRPSSCTDDRARAPPACCRRNIDTSSSLRSVAIAFGTSASSCSYTRARRE